MNNIVINETPVRTSRNFRINNFKIDEDEIDENIGKFTNYNLIGNGFLEEKNYDLNLTYGLGEKLFNQSKNFNNINIKLISSEKQENEINFNLDSKNQKLVENIEITAKEDSELKVIIRYDSKENIQNYHNGIIKLVAERNSKVKVVVVNFLNDKTNNFLSIENTLKDNSKVDYCIIDFGGKNSITNYYSNQIGIKSQNSLKTIYLGNKTQAFDLNYIAELRGEMADIDIDVQGALKDVSKKNFKGTIDFKKGCKKATGNENENCILLSDKAKSVALPMLLCSEEDVEGNHSSSAGKVGAKELFYIMSRGFSLNDAMKLLVRAKFNNIIENIYDEKLKNEILYYIDQKLD